VAGSQFLAAGGCRRSFSSELGRCREIVDVLPRARDNGVVSSEHRPDEQVEAPADATVSSALPANSAARQGRLTKQVVFLMLIGWLVAVILVVVLISVT
jgi:hypothetical protein